jgi:5,6,7,8-tetrahydromethanopterin hydro-lyase
MSFCHGLHEETSLPIKVVLSIQLFPHPLLEKERFMNPATQLYIGEGFEGPGVNLAHINVMVGPRNGPAGHAFATALATPSAGHAPFMVIAQPGIPTKPATLYVNKAVIHGDFHGNATWGASQAGIAKAVAEALESGVLPPEAENDWVVITANWVNPNTDDLDAVFYNNYTACKNALLAAMQGLPLREAVFAAAREVSNPFYTPKK